MGELGNGAQVVPFHTRGQNNAFSLAGRCGGNGPINQFLSLDYLVQHLAIQITVVFYNHGQKIGLFLIIRN
jgi:hypothetical protein